MMAPALSRLGLYLEEVAALLGQVPRHDLEWLERILRQTQGTGRMVYLLGNGGSAATAAHGALDLQKRAGLRALALTDGPLLTAWGNDAGYENVFAESLRRLLVPGDTVLLLSVSGASPNVRRAARLARALGAYTVALTGESGPLGAEVDLAIRVPNTTAPRVEDVHLVILHALAEALA